MVKDHSDSEKERKRNVLLNDTLNTFYLRLYGESEREMFYLTTHSTNFIYSYMRRERERNVLFNDALNTFYLRLYGEREREKCFI